MIHWSKKGEVNFKSMSGPSMMGSQDREITDKKILEYSPQFFQYYPGSGGPEEKEMHVSLILADELDGFNLVASSY
jgi:hypothetical protein